MVKKHKGGRRQILQLDDKKSSRSEWEPTSTATSNKEASPLDSQVADFFKEIDALTVNENAEEENSEAACTPSDVASCSKQKDPEEVKAEDGLQEKSEGSHSEETERRPYCPWQEICDESTGYNYYWNLDTNEVTWDCPSEYIIYLKNMQSSDSDTLKMSSQSNSNEIHKKSKKKKEPPQPPEGAIIPISYFGETSSSSSDDSSDEEKENGLGTTTTILCQKREAKFPSESKQRNEVKDDDQQSDIRKDNSVEAMGPHLPHNHFTVGVSSASRTSVTPNEPEMSSKNEVEEYLEIGPQLPSNSYMDLSKSSECNTVSDSSSKCSNISYSLRNGPTVASTTYEEPWEVSLMNIERKFKGLDQDIGEESPDSTVRKGDSLSENSVPCQTSNDTFGVRGVVEYDNFTDEEEEMSSSNISSSKQESAMYHRAFGYKKSKDRINIYDGQSRFESNKPEVSQSESQRILPKRKFFDKFDEYEDLSYKKSKQRDRVDIDNLFKSHSNTGKYGFGFSKQEQLNLESEFLCSTSNSQQFDMSKGSGDYKAISFVKSDHVFDLSILNKNISSGDNSHTKPSENGPTKDMCENIYAPGPSGLNGIKDFISSKESNFMQSDNTSRGKYGDVTKISRGSHHYSKAESSLEKVGHCSGHKDVSSSRTNDLLFRISEDIDEIDRALCEALEAKKSECSASKPSSSSSSSSPSFNQKIEETDESVSKRANNEFAEAAAKDGNLSEAILTLSSILIEKLNFLISKHSTLTTLGSLLIQLQTRLIDWQAGSLESMYFMSRLQEVHQYLLHYEVGAVSGDWTCQWDNENKRYFYMNTKTQQCQWTYPEELCGKENSRMPSSTDVASTSTASSDISVERDELQTVTSSVPEGQLHSKSSVTFTVESSKGVSDKYSGPSAIWMSASSPPPPPPGVDSPPPPPPHSPPPDSPPPPPPDSTEVEDLEDMDIENSDDSNPPVIVTNSRADTPADTHMQFPKFVIPSPERSSENFTNTSLANAVSSTSLSSFEDMNIVSKSPQLVSTSRDTFDTADSVNMHWSMSQPSCSTDVVNNFDSESEALVLLDLKLHSSDKESEMSASSSSRGYICSNEVSTYRKPSSPYSSMLKKEKKKTKLSPGLALKKKNIPSLVEKWQKIKEEQDKEDQNSDESKNS